MLTSQIIKKINDFVYSKPRTVDEIAKHIDMNWRTANRYVERIAEEQGNLGIRTFREGTRGALKVVYWNSIEQIHSTSFQEKLFRIIEIGKKKADFSPFDIYQHVDEKKKSAVIEENADENEESIKRLADILRSAEKQLLFFSGNLSWVNLEKGKTRVFDALEELAKRNVSIKILTRIDIATMNNIKKVLAINERLGRDIIEIRHKEQPLRANIVDDKLARLKEIKNPKDYKQDELKEMTYIFYNIYDKDWVEWLQKVFWNMFASAVPAEKRIKEINAIQKI